MKKKQIIINEELCIGCGICASTCKQSAIEMINGKAKVMHDDYCDGIGNCLPVCPVKAISFSDDGEKKEEKLPCGCPGSHVQEFKPTPNIVGSKNVESSSKLRQWPVQIKLVPENAPYFDGANLLIAADCVAYAYGQFHKHFMENKITIIGCPKLDMIDYTNKLTAIISNNKIKSVTVVNMEVPCCNGIKQATINALKASEKFIPWQTVTISTEGKIIEN